jgi:hypothetical protein
MPKKTAAKKTPVTRSGATLTLSLAGETYEQKVSAVTIEGVGDAISAIYSGPVKTKAIFTLNAGGKSAAQPVNGQQCRLILAQPKRAALFAKKLISVLR